jgi:hypothetical protein
MLRVYGWLSQVCGSVALAVLLLGMVAVVTHPAFAEDPRIPIVIVDTCTVTENWANGRLVNCTFAGDCWVSNIRTGCVHMLTRNSLGDLVRCSTCCQSPSFNGQCI